MVSAGVRAYGAVKKLAVRVVLKVPVSFLKCQLIHIAKGSG